VRRGIKARNRLWLCCRLSRRRPGCYRRPCRHGRAVGNGQFPRHCQQLQHQLFPGPAQKAPQLACDFCQPCIAALLLRSGVTPNALNTCAALLSTTFAWSSHGRAPRRGTHTGDGWQSSGVSSGAPSTWFPPAFRSPGTNTPDSRAPSPSGSARCPAMSGSRRTSHGAGPPG